MQLRNLTKNDINTVIDAYFEHKNEFYESDKLTIEDFYEQFCHKCDTCGRIICVLDMCEECDKERQVDEFWEFELNKENILYGI